MLYIQKKNTIKKKTTYTYTYFNILTEIHSKVYHFYNNTTIQKFNTYTLHKVKYQHISKNQINIMTLIRYNYYMHHSYTVLSYDSKILE
ncbi:hypothetical protein J2T04_002455 [Chryseobacterium lathyri]|uniref:Uncharacterized protein n=1 Tax=Chryseobacterium lathyri TaxID=395933 RepID=A0ABT9SMA9_9FLAO|nr:hypothetical protein [Chryseobacterium lathyri]MDQ0067183.1 hypothetical protein [Chryseobacterium lathyri]